MRHISALVDTSWSVRKRDRKLLPFPLVPGIAMATVIASFGVPLFDRHTFEQLRQGAHPRFGFYLARFPFYFVSCFVVIHFNSALIASVLKVMRGEKPTVGESLQAA